ncbi:MAG: hypothetical protein AAGA18_02170 [Verrucomicrobiota bacterium]
MTKFLIILSLSLCATLSYAQEQEQESTPEKTQVVYTVNPSILTIIPQSSGVKEGDVFIGQRHCQYKYSGWGWMKKEKESWSSARWVMIKEIPGRHKVPHRYLSDEHGDHGIRYKMWGRFADYKGYEPNTDRLVPIFILRGWEVIGVGEPINKKLPAFKTVPRTPRSTSFQERRPKKRFNDDSLQ